MLTGEQIERLEALLAAAPRTPWILATSNSWKRVLTELGNERVIVPCVDPDGHPNMDSYDNLTLVVEAINALPALLQLARAVSDSQRVRVDGVIRMLDGVSVVTTPKLTDATLRPLMGQTVALVPVPTTEGK